jgi:hypothetical protein
METESDGFVVTSCVGTDNSALENSLCFFDNENNACGVFQAATLALRDPHLLCTPRCAPHMDAIFSASAAEHSPRKSEIVAKLADSLSYAHCRYCRLGCWMLNWFYY